MTWLMHKRRVNNEFYPIDLNYNHLSWCDDIDYTTDINTTDINTGGKCEFTNKLDIFNMQETIQWIKDKEIHQTPHNLIHPNKLYELFWFNYDEIHTPPQLQKRLSTQIELNNIKKY